MQRPSLEKVAVADPKGKVTGSVDLVFVDATGVLINTWAHINTRSEDEPGVTFRDTEYLVHVHARRDDDGTWYDSHPAEYTVSKRYSLNTYAAPTYRRAIVDALLATVAEHWTPELGEQAHVAETRMRLVTVEDQLSRLRKQVAELDAEARPLRAILRAADGQ